MKENLIMVTYEPKEDEITSDKDDIREKWNFAIEGAKDKSMGI